MIETAYAIMIHGIIQSGSLQQLSSLLSFSCDLSKSLSKEVKKSFLTSLLCPRNFLMFMVKAVALSIHASENCEFVVTNNDVQTEML